MKLLKGLVGARKRGILKYMALYLTGILIVFVTYLLLSSDLLTKNEDFILYFSSAVIQSYAALIAIPLSISAYHLSRQYGFSSIDILINKSRNLISIYFTIVSISILNMLLNLDTVQNLKIEILGISTNTFSLMLSAQIAVTVLPLYCVLNYLRDVLIISPIEIMKILGYPDEVVKSINKAKLYEANAKFSKGLSLIRTCITDLALRDELGAVVSTFTKTIGKIPWYEKIEELTGKGRMDTGSLFYNIFIRLDECIIEPLINTNIKPDVHIFTQFFNSLGRACIDTHSTNSSVFNEYIDKLYRITANYVKNGKKEALHYFFFLHLWTLGELSTSALSKILSRGINLSASLLRYFETDASKIDDIRYIFFVTSNGLQMLANHPTAFVNLRQIDDLIYLIEKSDRIFLGHVIICLPFIEKELENIRKTEHEFIYKRTLANFLKVKAKVVEVLKRRRWRVFVYNNSLNILNIDDETIGAIQFSNILEEEKISDLESFIKRHLVEPV